SGNTASTPGTALPTRRPLSMLGAVDLTSEKTHWLSVWTEKNPPVTQQAIPVPPDMALAFVALTLSKWQVLSEKVSGPAMNNTNGVLSTPSTTTFFTVKSPADTIRSVLV